MSKGLEALERLYCAGRLDLCYVQSEKHKKDYELIEKELKALEIIKLKYADIGWLIRSENCSKYNLGVGSNQALKKKEYDILKEVLLWERNIKDI